MASRPATPPHQRSDDQVRQIMLEYFYQRNKTSTSRRGKNTGAAATISIIRADLKEAHGLTVHQVQSNLTYLLSQGWVEDEAIVKSVSTPSGGIIPSSTSYYIITAAGIDKIDGPSAFTRSKFEGIRIEATGQNIITLGDGNQVNANFREIGEALSRLRDEVRTSNALDDTSKVDLVTDIDTIQGQLAKASPNKSVVQNLWDSVQKAGTVAGLGSAVSQVVPYMSRLLGG